MWVDFLGCPHEHRALGGWLWPRGPGGLFLHGFSDSKVCLMLSPLPPPLPQTQTFPPCLHLSLGLSLFLFPLIPSVCSWV